MKRWLAIGALVFIASVGLWTYHWWHSPAESLVVSGSSQTQGGVLGSESTLQTWQTEYFTTRYPTMLRVIMSNEIPQGRTDGQYLLGSSSFKFNDQLAVTVGNLSDLQLNELPALKLREQQTALYQQTARAYTPPHGFVFQKIDTYETAVFWQHGNQYAAVVVSGSAARRGELEQTLESVIVNWQWRS